MDNSDVDTSKIGRYQIVSSGGDSNHILAVLDTVTGRVWVKEISLKFRENRELLKEENQVRTFWEDYG
jgi:hypothetical protein